MEWGKTAIFGVFAWAAIALVVITASGGFR